MTDIPTLPKGYFFEVTKGTFFTDPTRHIWPTVMIKKRVWLFWTTTEFTINLTKITLPHPTPDHVLRGMVAAKEGWLKSVEESRVYGQYPSNSIKDFLNGTTSS